MPAARVAYRTGRTDFDNAVENIEEMWRKLCSSMPEDVGKMYLHNLAVLKDVSGISKTHQFKDVLRNLSNIYIDEGANIAYKDFLDCSDLLLGNILDSLEDWSKSDVSKLNEGEGLKLLQLVLSCCKLRSQINLTQRRKQARILELEQGCLKRAKADPRTILLSYKCGSDEIATADSGKAANKKVSSGKQKMGSIKKH